MDAVWAEEVLREHGGELSPEGVKRMTLLATGDEWVAQAAYSAAYLKQRREQFESEP